ncbi:MAG: TonB-dependent receptor [Candidatus Pedobacter colombiensis]|uniref:TonB-dependent receptor n=1 Tax=Candidatus Pedobacter colombiensis TaxID=3121371 RepID=A0AAJ6BAS3_9SPHI|nr:TonB-dependent receptor [Pedobacter sp.]WEK21558.1 MAG: TonB-dependent receptor [Pedobacter sp.]
MKYLISIKFILLFLWIFNNNLQAQVKNVLEHKVSINLPADSLIKTIHRIELKTKNSFAFDPDQLRSEKVGAYTFVQTPLSVILEKILSNTNLDFKLVGNDIVIAQKKTSTWTIRGHIRDMSNGEELIGATFYIPKLDVGVTTNLYGFYSISVPAGAYKVTVSYFGYQTIEQSVYLNENKDLEIELPLKTRHLDEVVIRQSMVTPNPILLNEKNFTVKQLSNVPYYAGETDVVKRLQMENGIKALSEGSSGLFVRGGNADQNLVLLDEAVVYNPSHLYGLISVFNPDAINNIQIYRDYMPANYGGRLSSVIVNRMAEGNSKEYHLNGGVNFMSARLSAEGPIVNEKGSFIVAFRRSLLDVFHNKFKLFNPQSVYYDINAKANIKPDKDNSIFYSMYLGKDKLLSENSFANNWGNLTATLRWNHIFSSRVFLNVSAIYSNYSNLLDLNADTLSKKNQWNTGVKDMTLKSDYTYYRSPTNQIKFGLATTYHQFIPGESSKSKSDDFDIPKDRSLESAIYYSQQITLSKLFEINYGLRLGMFINAQQKKNVFDQNGFPLNVEDVKTFINPEPRINLSYLPSITQRVFVTYNRNYQYLQLLQNSTLAFSSLEPWLPASARIAPQSSDYFSLGYLNSPDNYVFSVNAYYKKLYNQLELMGHAQIIRNPDVGSQLRIGKSDAYGFETQLTKTEGKFSGTIAYSYSKVYRKINGLNSDNRFVANYDIPHELKAMAKYELNKQLSFQSFFIYSTGRPLTLPVGYYQHDGLNVPIYEDRNTSRFPDFSRLDVSAQYRFESKIFKNRFLSNVVSVGIYNLYNRKNPLYYHLNPNTNSSNSSNIEYAFGIYPWIAYSFKI